MRHDDPQPFTARRRALHRLLTPIVTATFVGTLITDWTYWRTEDMQWANFSIWMLTGGLLVGAAAVLTALVDRARGAGMTLPAGVAFVAALVFALFNAFVHSRDAYTSVVPGGLTLSVLTVLALAAYGLVARRPVVVRHRAAVAA